MQVQKLPNVAGRYVNLVTIQNTSIIKSVNVLVLQDTAQPDLHKILTLVNVPAGEYVQMDILLIIKNVYVSVHVDVTMVSI